jgi:NADPH-dependent curcumin reductase CurA
MTTSREVRLIARPVGTPKPSDFEVASVELADPVAGEVQVRNHWMSVDPYMRGRMRDAKSYAAPYELDQAMHGGAVGEVVKSNDPSLKEGDMVQSGLGWREAFNAPAGALQKIDTNQVPAQAYLGVAGMPGLTAYVGLLHVAALKDGDVVFVSAASGAVGAIVCQIVKLKGHKVIGSAGGPEKCAWLKSIGVDEVIDYRAEPDLTAALMKAAPEGIDVYFENVGGAHMDAALACANHRARFALCGMIAGYNNPDGAIVRNLMLAVGRSIRLQGFIVFSEATEEIQAQFRKDIVEWISSGKITWKETVEDGIDNAVTAFLKLFSGENTGKMLVKLN